MDLHTYIDRLEDHVENPDELRRIQQEAEQDGALHEDDVELIKDRAGRYLADLGRGEDVAIVDDVED